MMIAAQRMAHQHGIGTLRIQRAVGFIDDVIAGQYAAAGQHQRFIEMLLLRADDANAVSGARRCAHVATPGSDGW